MIELEVRIPDSPGALIKLIKPISENSGNIHGILHSHKDKINGNIPVLIRFEFLTKEKKANLEKIKKIFQSIFCPQSIKSVKGSNVYFFFIEKRVCVLLDFFKMVM